MSHEKIVRAATRLAIKLGFQNMSRQQIADHVGCFPSQISFHVGTMREVQDAIVQYAIDHALKSSRFHYVDVVAQALAARHPLAIRAVRTSKELSAALLVVLAA